jgi:hypothetical protein
VEFALAQVAEESRERVQVWGIRAASLDLQLCDSGRIAGPGRGGALLAGPRAPSRGAGGSYNPINLKQIAASLSANCHIGGAVSGHYVGPERTPMSSSTLAKAHDRLERAEGLKARIMAKKERLEDEVLGHDS